MAGSRNVYAMGTACVASGVIGVLLGAFTLAYPVAVSADVWSYPFPYGVALALGFLLAVTHLLTLAGFAGIRILANGRFGRWVPTGLWIAIAGFAVLAVSEVAGGFIGDKPVDSDAAAVVATAFGVGSLMTAVGALLSGTLLIRRRAWQRVGAWAMTASGVTMAALVTPANISGGITFRMISLILWSACFIPLGIVLTRSKMTASTPSVAAARGATTP